MTPLYYETLLLFVLEGRIFTEDSTTVLMIKIEKNLLRAKILISIHFMYIVNNGILSTYLSIFYITLFFTYIIDNTTICIFTVIVIII
jgi:hypothetical protein